MQMPTGRLGKPRYSPFFAQAFNLFIPFGCIATEPSKASHKQATSCLGCFNDRHIATAVFSAVDKSGCALTLESFHHHRARSG